MSETKKADTPESQEETPQQRTGAFGAKEEISDKW